MGLTHKYTMLCMLFFLTSICFGQSKKTLKVIDKQVVLNSSLEFKQLEKHLETIWDSLDQVGQSWVINFQKKIQKCNGSCCLLSEAQLKKMQENIKREEQIIYNFADYRTDTCRIIKEEIEALVFDKILEEFNLENASESISVVDKSRLRYFAEKVDVTEAFQQFVSNRILFNNMRNNSYFDICETVFKKYKLNEKLSLKSSPSFNY